MCPKAGGDPGRSTSAIRSYRWLSSCAAGSPKTLCVLRTRIAVSPHFWRTLSKVRLICGAAGKGRRVAEVLTVGSSPSSRRHRSRRICGRSFRLGPWSRFSRVHWNGLEGPLGFGSDAFASLDQERPYLARTFRTETEQECGLEVGYHPSPSRRRSASILRTPAICPPPAGAPAPRISQTPAAFPMPKPGRSTASATRGPAAARKARSPTPADRTRRGRCCGSFWSGLKPCSRDR